jgi:hypothetical protein
MRKWYGETDKLTMPEDMLPRDESEDGGPDDSSPRDAVLVTGADTPLGELIVLQLVLARCALKVSHSSRNHLMSFTMALCNAQR